MAADGDGLNGLYTQNLLAALDVAGLTVEQVQKHVASGVKKASGNRQEPWMEGLIEGDFYFRRVDAKPDEARGLKPVSQVTPAGPVAPVTSGLDLADLQRDDTVRGDWAAWQTRMQADYDKARGYQGSAENRAKAWGRFLDAYPQDNPYSDADERLRTEAQQAKRNAENLACSTRPGHATAKSRQRPPRPDLQGLPRLPRDGGHPCRQLRHGQQRRQQQ